MNRNNPVRKRGRKRTPIDTIDKRILRHLQQHPEANQAEVGQAIGLDHSAVSRRLKRLKDDQVVLPTELRIDPEALGLVTTVYTLVQLKTHTEGNTEKFEQELPNIPNIIEWCAIHGSWDYLLKSVVKGTQHYDMLHAHLLGLAMVARVRGMHAKFNPHYKPLPIPPDDEKATTQDIVVLTEPLVASTGPGPAQ